VCETFDQLSTMAEPGPPAVAASLDPSDPAMEEAIKAAAAQLGMNAEDPAVQDAIKAQLGNILNQVPMMNPVQAQLMQNPDLAAKMMGPAGLNSNIGQLDGASCTIYVGNLNPSISAEQLTQFFQAVCGQVTHVRLAGDDPATAYRFDRSRFAFVQFPTKEQADLGMTLTGTVLGGLPIKCGPAKNPIVATKPVMPTAADNAMSDKLAAAQANILQKLQKKAAGIVDDAEDETAGQAAPVAVEPAPEAAPAGDETKERDRDRERERDRDRRDRSPGRRRSRSRSPNRRRSRSPRRRRSRSRSRDRHRRSRSR